MKNTKMFPMKISIFTAEKNLCILHGQVFIMSLISAGRQQLHNGGFFILTFFFISHFIVHLSLDKYMTDFCLFVRYNQVSHCSYF